MSKVKDVVNEINKRYVRISNRITNAYTKTFGLKCDIYFPIFDPYNETTKYRDMKIFTPHQSPTYSKEPDVVTYFYIPFLIPAMSMNSSESEFDSFFTAETQERPFIETTKKRELPIATKVVVHQGQSISKFFVDKKLVVTGADGMMLLRMYLAPLAKDNDEDEEEQTETTIEGTRYDPPAPEGSENTGLGSALGATRSIETTEEEVEEVKPKKRRGRKKKSETNIATNVASVDDSSLMMNIPED